MFFFVKVHSIGSFPICPYDENLQGIQECQSLIELLMSFHQIRNESNDSNEIEDPRHPNIKECKGHREVRKT